MPQHSQNEAKAAPTPHFLCLPHQEQAEANNGTEGDSPAHAHPSPLLSSQLVPGEGLGTDACLVSHRGTRAAR